MIKKSFILLTMIILLVLSAGCDQTPTASPTAKEPTPNITDYPVSQETTYPVTEEPAQKPTSVATQYPVEETGTPEPTPGESVMLQSIKMFPDLQGWGLTGRYDLLHTEDGGMNWRKVTPSSPQIPEGESGPGLSTAYWDGQTAWYLLSDYETSTLFLTTDAGLTWSETALAFPGGSMDFRDASNGYLLSSLGVGAGSQYVALYHTADRGLTWEQRFTHEPGVEKDLPSSGLKSGIAFVDDTNGWITGNEPVEDFIYLFRTRNGGINWEEASCTMPDEVSGSFLEAQPPIFVDAVTGFLPIRAYGAAEPYPLLFCRTTDAGGTWTYVSTIPVGIYLPAYDFSDASTGWISSGETLYITTDGANTWQDLIASLPAGEMLLQVDSISAEIAWLLTSPDPEDYSVKHLYQTVDGGVTWERLPATLDESDGGG